MDVSSYAASLTNGTLGLGLPFPGNAEGQTVTPQVDGTTEQSGGAANSSWSNYASKVGSVLAWPVTAPYHVVHGAYEEVKGAASRAADLVDSAKAATVQAATGFASWTKWVVVGLIAVAVIYVLAMAAPFIPKPMGKS